MKNCRKCHDRQTYFHYWYNFIELSKKIDRSTSCKTAGGNCRSLNEILNRYNNEKFNDGKLNSRTNISPKKIDWKVSEIFYRANLSNQTVRVGFTALLGWTKMRGALKLSQRMSSMCRLLAFFTITGTGENVRIFVKISKETQNNQK